MPFDQKIICASYLFGERRFGPGHGDWIVRNATTYQTKISDWPTFHGGRKSGLTTAMETTQTIYAFRRRQITLAGGTFVYI